MEQTPATDSVPDAELPPTAQASIEEALGLLRDLDEAPVHEHPAVYAEAHEHLRQALGDADAATPGPRTAPGVDGRPPAG